MIFHTYTTEDESFLLWCQIQCQSLPRSLLEAKNIHFYGNEMCCYATLQGRKLHEDKPVKEAD
jgi:hypothetical protein